MLFLGNKTKYDSSFAQEASWLVERKSFITCNVEKKNYS